MKTVLIVDDEQIVLDVLKRILDRIGYDSVVTDSGKSALERFSKKTFDLVLMDVLMPGKNGFEIAKEMRRIKPDQKIVMVTGLGLEAAMSEAVSESIFVDNVLSKPFSYEKVRTTLAKLLDGENEVYRKELSYS